MSEIESVDNQSHAAEFLDSESQSAAFQGDEGGATVFPGDEGAATVFQDDEGRATTLLGDQSSVVTSADNQSRARQQAVFSFLQNLPHASLIFQLFRFGLVGIIAAAIHFCIVVSIVQTYALEPLVANIFAFMVSFQVSYFGHRRFTFTGTTALHAVAFPKLLTLQMFNFVANESLFYFFLSLHMPYQLALILVLSILPLFTFTVSRMWIFPR